MSEILYFPHDPKPLEKAINRNVSEIPSNQNQPPSVIPPDVPSLPKDFQSEVNNATQAITPKIESSLIPSEVDEFLNTLKQSLPPELRDYFNSLTAKDIAEIITVVITVGILIATGVGAPAAVGIVTSRLGLEAVTVRLITAGLSRPGITSAIMGLIPGMKNSAPYPGVAFVSSEMKNALGYLVNLFS